MNTDTDRPSEAMLAASARYQAALIAHQNAAASDCKTRSDSLDTHKELVCARFEMEKAERAERTKALGIQARRIEA